ncbi:hypothetical protein TNCV_4370441 [Trichonephila clavipes]|uniref:Uncharacterized protein n=1 Tax=Trichonephila clavipes TaxID=2585209 RepID=A0A8X6S2A2_TRICX|nr:hypothetical protein TNCV_4370441 [Trichonephila clavipes]
MMKSRKIFTKLEESRHMPHLHSFEEDLPLEFHTDLRPVLKEPDKAQKPRLPDPIVQPIVVMPHSRMYNTTFVMPPIKDLS